MADIYTNVGTFKGQLPDFNKLGHGDPVQGLDGYSWYHTGQNAARYGNENWIQAPTGTDLATGGVPPPAAPGQSAGNAPGQSVAAPTNLALQSNATVGAQAPQGSQASVTGAFQQALLNRLMPGPTNAQSPEISGAITANRGAEQRSLERQRAQLAETAASRGLDQNAFGSQLRGLEQQRAQREGQFEGQAVMNLAKQRADNITSALALSGGLMSDQDRMALQRELSLLQAQLQREGVAAQTNLGHEDLGLRRDLGMGQLNLGLLNALLGNQQFGQNLGANLGMFGANLNQNAILAQMGML